MSEEDAGRGDLMSWRFRRNVRICKGVHLNFNKSGMGLSVGGRGFHVGTGPRGRYMSMGLPGTGLYSINYLKNKQKKPRGATTTASKQASNQSMHSSELPAELKDQKSSAGCLLFVVSIIALIAYWPVGLLLLVGTAVWQFARRKMPDDQARGYYFQGQRALEKDDHAGALDAFKKVIEVKPETPSINLKIADIEREQGHFDEAVASYEKYLAAGTNEPFVLFHYAVALACDKQHEKAIGILQGLPAETRQELPVINTLATCFLDTGRPQAALEVLKEGPTRKRTMDDQMLLFHYLLGAAYKELGDKKKAAAQLSKVIAENENYLDAKGMLEQLDVPAGGQ